MSGMSFATKGGPGPATQTVWFGAIVDRLNMLMPFNFPTQNMTSTVPAHYGNLWTNFNSSFGATTTAPDGTTANSQLLQEDSSNNVHFCQAGTPQDQASSLQSFSPVGLLRMAGIFKNVSGVATRRVGFKIRNDFGGPINTITVVFDLAGGQVGVAANVSGTDSNGLIIAKGTQIIALPSSLGGGGWFMCIQDMYWQYAGNSSIVAEIFLDNGTGTGALSNSYTGNGSSGVYVWRTNFMPLAAWGMGTQTYLSDFLSINEIDVNNTLQPGFKWYPHHGWLNYNTPSPDPFPANQISVSGSVLTLTGPSDSSAIALGSAAQTNAAAGTFVGQGFGAGKPTLFESRISWDYGTHNPTSNNTLTWWCSGLEWIVSQGKGFNAQTTLRASREIDIMEASGTNANSTSDSDFLLYVGVSGSFSQPSEGAGSITSHGGIGAAWGFPAWLSTFPYRTNNIAIQGGVAYKSKSDGNLNNMPPNATFWTALSYPSSMNQPAALVDYTQMHLYSMLIIPFWGNGAAGLLAQQPTWKFGVGHVSGSTPDIPVGLKLQFYEGALIAINTYWGPNVNPGGAEGSYAFNSDNQNMGIWLSPGGTTGQQMNVDFFRVIQ